MANYIPDWTELTASLFCTSQSWGTSDKSTRLAQPFNEHLVRGFSSGSYFRDTETNFIFKSIGDWSSIFSSSYHDADQILSDLYNETNLLFSQSRDHIYQLNMTTQGEPQDAYGHLVGGAFSIDILQSRATTDPRQDIVDLIGPFKFPRWFGCIQSASNAGNGIDYTFYSGSFESEWDYTVVVQPLFADRYFFINQAFRSKDGFRIEERQTSTQNGIGPSTNIYSNRYDLFVFSLNAVTGSEVLP